MHPNQVAGYSYTLNPNKLYTRARRRIYIESLTLADWDESKSWSRDELDHFATLIMKAAKPLQEDPKVLDFNAFKERRKKEIQLSNGDMDQIIAPGMYWRTHPEGRKFRDERKGTGRGFYR